MHPTWLGVVLSTGAIEGRGIRTSRIFRKSSFSGLALAMLSPIGANSQVLLDPVGGSPQLLSAETAPLPTCTTLSGSASNCASVGLLDQTQGNENSQFIGAPVVPGSSTPATFTSAFNAWNASNYAATGQTWTLVNGGALDVSITAFVYPATFAYPGLQLGGLIAYFVLGGSQIPTNLVWTQALVTNYTALTGPLAHPIQTLDTFSLSQDAAGDNPNFPLTCSPASSSGTIDGGTFCDPIYPFQYGDTLASQTVLDEGVYPLGIDPFIDAPAYLWPDASFDAVTLLSTVSPTSDTLTVYQGVRYGFFLVAVPEPSTWAMLALGFGGLGLVGHRGANGRLGRRRH
jgi:hypothetical protein